MHVGSKETPSDPNRNIDRPTSEDPSREGIKGAGASVLLDAAEANVDERARLAPLPCGGRVRLFKPRWSCVVTIEGAMARTIEARSCKLCSEQKPLTAFYESTLKKSFPAWCKPCHIRMISERRRGDPAARVRTRAYMRERRAGRALAISIRDIRSLLAKEDEQSIRQDILSLERMREDEPLDVQNAILVKKVKQPKEAD